MRALVHALTNGRKARGATRLASLLLLVLVLLVALPAPVSADAITAAFPSFDSDNIALFRLNGNAGLSGSSLRLTTNSTGLYGSAWFQRRVSLLDDRSFSAYFVMYIHDSLNGGADGIVFAIQPNSNAAGSTGGGMGYEGIANSVGIEFDTWDNGGSDPNGNHIGIDVEGSVYSLQVALPPSGGILEDTIWYVWVDYDGIGDQLEVRMSTNSARPASATMSRSIDLSAHFGADVYVGFTAATGAVASVHEIRSFFFHNDYIPGGLTPDTAPYTMAPSQVDVTASPLTLPADGSTQSTITATVKDVTGAVMPNEPVTFGTTLGALSSTSATTNASGQATVYLTSSSVGTATIRATATGGAYGEATVSVLGAPEIEVRGNGVVIADGDATPSLSDHTGFGSVSVASGSVVRTYTIYNTGNIALTVGSVGRSGSTDFTVSAQPAGSMAAGGSTTFQVAFDPSSPGLKQAALSFTNSDSNENPFNFAIEGMGLSPEMQVEGNGQVIASGGGSPSTSNHTDFGAVATAAGTVVRTFTVRNVGSENLTLNGIPRVAVGGAHAADFTVTALPSTPVAAGGTTTFQVTFDPSADGQRVASLSIANNDLDENPYG